MILAYPSMPEAYWKESHIATLIERFPEGQVVLKINGQLAGCALSIRVMETTANKPHTYEEITGDTPFPPTKATATCSMALTYSSNLNFGVSDSGGASTIIAKNCAKNSI